MNEGIIKKAGEIIKKNTREASYCALGLIDKNGYPTISTITASTSEGIEYITFCSGLYSNKAERIRGCDRASVCFNTGGEYNISLVGTMEIVTDPEIKKENWYSGLENHFSGADDPDYCVLRFHTKRYNLMVDWQETAGELEVE